MSEIIDNEELLRGHGKLVVRGVGRMHNTDVFDKSLQSSWAQCPKRFRLNPKTLNPRP